MATYSTFFVARESEIDSIFAGWVHPLPAPERRKGKNPFTGAPLEFVTWEPTDIPKAPKPSFVTRALGAATGKRNPRVAVIKGDFRAYLEDRLDPRIRALPHFCTKSLLPAHLQEIDAALGGELGQPLRPARFSLRGDNRMLERLPEASTRTLACLSDADLRARALELADDGALSADGWSDADTELLLRELRDLASRALMLSGSLLLLIE